MILLFAVFGCILRVRNWFVFYFWKFLGLDEEQRNRRIIEKARNEEDEYDQKTKSQMESYYATAHRIKEKVVKQHSTLGGGNPNLQLKPYQVLLDKNIGKLSYKIFNF